MVANLEEIILNSKYKEVLMRLPFDKFKALCSRDDIKIEREQQIISLIEGYIKEREKISEARNRPGAEQPKEEKKAEIKEEKKDDKKEDKKEEKKDILPEKPVNKFDCSAMYEQFEEKMK
jgi:hypothetical protein